MSFKGGVVETFGRGFRRGRETCAEQGREPCAERRTSTDGKTVRGDGLATKDNILAMRGRHMTTTDDRFSAPKWFLVAAVVRTGGHGSD